MCWMFQAQYFVKKKKLSGHLRNGNAAWWGAKVWKKWAFQAKTALSRSRNNLIVYICHVREPTFQPTKWIKSQFQACFWFSVRFTELLILRPPWKWDKFLKWHVSKQLTSHFSSPNIWNCWISGWKSSFKQPKNLKSLYLAGQSHN